MSMNITRPTQPAGVITPAGSVNKDQPRERVRSSFLIRWDAVITVIVASVIALVVGMGIQFAIDHADPWNGVPVCTDSIADAGGICHGEPR